MFVQHTRLGLSEGLDTQVQGTNDDAQISKLSCARAGYFQDAFVQYFVRKAQRRSPLINRGYYSRYAGLRQLLRKFLDITAAAGQPSQLLILGAGFDTTWFQLAAAGKAPTRTLELDFKQVTQRKVACIKQQPVLMQLLQQHHQLQQQQPQAAPAGTPPAGLAAAVAAGAEGSQQQQQHCPITASTSPTAGVHTATPTDLHGTATTTGVSTTAATTAGLPTEHPSSTRSTTCDTTTSAAGAHTHPTLTSGNISGRAPTGGNAPADCAPTGSATTGPAPALTSDGRAPTGASPTAGTCDGSAAGGVHINPSAGELLSSSYSVLPADLRDTAALPATLQRAGLDPRLPTYVLAECVLVYMEPAASTALLHWVSATFSNAAMVIYEQIKPDDAFGRQMMSNLESRGCPLRGLPATPSLEAHCQRLLDAGWRVARSWSMDSVYKWHLDPHDKARIEALEVFDEFEEWHLIQEHYSITLGLGPAGPSSTPAAGLGTRESTTCAPSSTPAGLSGSSADGPGSDAFGNTPSQRGEPPSQPASVAVSSQPTTPTTTADALDATTAAGGAQQAGGSQGQAAGPGQAQQLDGLLLVDLGFGEQGMVALARPLP